MYTTQRVKWYKHALNAATFYNDAIRSHYSNVC